MQHGGLRPVLHGSFNEALGHRKPSCGGESKWKYKSPVRIVGVARAGAEAPLAEVHELLGCKAP